ncbi:MAG: hypothetical protein KIS85_05405 [Anaerolineales bacterium]|nr:hypothetical protein [Anaerolineales bacterium]
MEDNLMDQGGFRPLVNTVQYPVIIQTVHNRIQGNLHARENERIKDALNSNEPFVAITKVQIFDPEGVVELKRSDFMAINREHIIWIIENKPPSGTLGR